MMNHYNFQQVHYHRDEWIVMMGDLFQSFPIISLVLRIINEHDESSLPQSASKPSVMDCDDERSIQIISFTFSTFDYC